MSTSQTKTTPLQEHEGHDEIIVVLAGKLVVHANGNPRTVGAGGLVVTPRDVPHAFLVTSDTARVLAIATPGTNAQAFYRGASADGTTGAVDFGKVGASAKETGATTMRVTTAGAPPG